MSTEPGKTLLRYRLVQKIGAGGMGEVWKAVDTDLGREVAIKLLPQALADDAERLARFEREARLLASLNHPNIATIHGLESAGPTRFLVMELVGGEDLAQRLARGPLPVEDALAAAVQVAAALESAHERGVIHRDLKPANVKTAPDGTVKVLDFGLAKALEPARTSGDPSASPTVTSAGTVAGMILGTAAYMSPEQAKGKPVDRRADIWAFGAMLYEMLTGRRLFGGESISEVLAVVLMGEIDLDRLPPNTPPRIRRLIERCLRRDPGSRLRDIGDARIVIEEALAAREWTAAAMSADAAARPARVPGGWWGVALALAIGAIAGVGTMLALHRGGPADTETAVRHVAIPLPRSMRVRGAMLTPAGSRVVFRAIDLDSQAPRPSSRLFVRDLSDDEPVEVPGSQNVSLFTLSPDGRWLAFIVPVSERSTRLELKKAPVDLSTPAAKIADWPDEAGGSLLWPTSDRLLTLRQTDYAIMPIPADGGSRGPVVEVTADPPPFSLRANAMLPGGRVALVHAATFESGEYRQGVGALDLETGQLHRLVDSGSYPGYAPTGHLLFTRRDQLLAVRFDPEHLQVDGGARAVLSGLWAEGLWTGGEFALSQRGDLLYPAGTVQGTANRLAIVTQDGDVSRDWSADRLPLNDVAVSPDGKRIAVQVDNVGQGEALLQIRVSDFARPALVTVGTRPGKDCDRPRWSPDSRSLAFTCTDQSGIDLHAGPVERAASADPILHVPAGTRLYTIGFTVDGNRAIARRVEPDGTSRLLVVPVAAPVVSTAEAREIPMETREWTDACGSPDGRWLAYVANESGSRNLVVRSVTSEGAVGPSVLVAQDATGPRWGKTVSDGRYELWFFKEGRLHSVELTARPEPRVASTAVRGLIPDRLGARAVDTLPDGNLLVILAPDTDRGAAELRLVLNWTRELAALH